MPVGTTSDLDAPAYCRPRQSCSCPWTVLGLRLMRPSEHRRHRRAFFPSISSRSATIRRNCSSEFCRFSLDSWSFLLPWILDLIRPRLDPVRPPSEIASLSKRERMRCLRAQAPESLDCRVPLVIAPLGGDTDVEPCAAGEGTRARRVRSRLRPSCGRYRRRDASARGIYPCIAGRTPRGRSARFDEREHIFREPFVVSDRHPTAISIRLAEGATGVVLQLPFLPQHIAGREPHP